MTIRRLEIILISLIALHSTLLGAGMLFWPGWTLELFGWDYHGAMFFPAQTGIFLLLFAAAYLTSIWHQQLVWLIIVSKSTAVVFLLSQYYLLGPAAPMTIPVAALLDGLMGTAVIIITALKARSNRTTV